MKNPFTHKHPLKDKPSQERIPSLSSPDRSILAARPALPRAARPYTHPEVTP